MLPKKRNPQDLTLRNLRALKRQIGLTQAMFRFTDECYLLLEQRVAELEGKTKRARGKKR